MTTSGKPEVFRVQAKAQNNFTIMPTLSTEKASALSATLKNDSCSLKSALRTTLQSNTFIKNEGFAGANWQ